MNKEMFRLLCADRRLLYLLLVADAFNVTSSHFAYFRVHAELIADPEISLGISRLEAIVTIFL